MAVSSAPGRTDMNYAQRFMYSICVITAFQDRNEQRDSLCTIHRLKACFKYDIIYSPRSAGKVCVRERVSSWCIGSCMFISAKLNVGSTFNNYLYTYADDRNNVINILLVPKFARVCSAKF